jgi:aromatic-amino-acid transaminase
MSSSTVLTNLQQQPADALLALIKLHNNDPRADKIDLGVGVYRTDTGATPVFKAIKAAEQ